MGFLHSIWHDKLDAISISSASMTTTVQRTAKRSARRSAAPANARVDRPSDSTLEEELSSTEATYNDIKRMILSGQARPGRKLVHQDLATHLNVSRTPVREALER